MKNRGFFFENDTSLRTFSLIRISAGCTKFCTSVNLIKIRSNVCFLFWFAYRHELKLFFRIGSFQGFICTEKRNTKSVSGKNVHLEKFWSSKSSTIAAKINGFILSKIIYTRNRIKLWKPFIFNLTDTQKTKINVPKLNFFTHF